MSIVSNFGEINLGSKVCYTLNMNDAIIQLTIPLLLIFLAGYIINFFLNHGVDKLKHPEEWRTKGASGERIFYKLLIDKIGIPENQILRNVYIPTKPGKTSEIDLLVISKKAIFVFEVKNYGGNIYGDRDREKWIQYVGRQKHFFYNPFLQNETHVKHLKEFLSGYQNIPIIPMTTTISRGNWKVKNLKPNDYFLGYNSHFVDIYKNLPIANLSKQDFDTILKKLTPLSRPSQKIRDKHISQIKK